MLLLTNDKEAYASSRIWGTGGWVPPEYREALDWMTLARLSGWRPTIRQPTPEALLSKLAPSPHWLVLACDPSGLDQSVVDAISSMLVSTDVVVLARAGMPEHPISVLTGASAAGQRVESTELRWHGETSSVFSVPRRLSLESLALMPDARPLVTANGLPLVAVRKVGRGCVVSLGFHPSAARDQSGLLTRLLRRVLVESSPRPVAWLDLSGTMVLRMDDPGTAQNAYLQSWVYPELDYSLWSEIGTALSERSARLSVGYCSGWVDDGDPSRGVLKVGGETVSREGGKVHPAPEVTYLDKHGSLPGTFHDYAGEYAALRQLLAAGVVDIELHGYTHMYPDGATWSMAPDRYTKVDWFREVGMFAKSVLDNVVPELHPLSLGFSAIAAYFGVRPTTLICPGDEWTNEALAHALDLGVSLVSSYYLALRHDDRFCWVTHVCAPYLDEPDADWFDSGLPVIGYFHDREPSLHGANWVAEWVNLWQQAGAQRFIGFRELAGALERTYDVQEYADGLRLEVSGGSGLPLAGPLKVKFKLPGSELPPKILVSTEVGEFLLSVASIEDEIGEVWLPC